MKRGGKIEMSAQKSDTTRRFTRREMLRLSAITMAGAVAVACAPPAAAPAEGEGAAPSADKVTIVATSQMPINTWDNALERARDQLPGIDLKVTATQIGGIGWSGYSDLIVTQIAGGEQLDVIMIAIEGLRLLTDKNILVPLDPFFEADTEAQSVLMEDVHVTLREMLQVDGKQMEYPFSWNNMVMYYNTAILEEEGLESPAPDWTWEDFLATCQTVARVTGSADDRYAYSFWGGSFFGMHAWFFTNDTSVLTDDWQDSNMLDPKVSETLQFLADLILEHKVAPNPTGWDEDAQLHAGNLVMRTCGRWCIGASLENDFTTYDLQYQPHRSGPTRTVAGTDGWGMSSATKAEQEAWEVVKFLSNTDAAIDMVQLGGNIPALRSVAEMPVFAEYGPPNTAIFYESLDYAKTVPSPTNFNVIEPIMNRHLDTIWNGEKSVEEAVVACHDEMQAEMDKLRA
jgi:multiple sugar transport system substrate-binding protein